MVIQKSINKNVNLIWQLDNWQPHFIPTSRFSVIPHLPTHEAEKSA